MLWLRFGIVGEEGFFVPAPMAPEDSLGTHDAMNIADEEMRLSYPASRSSEIYFLPSLSAM